MNLHFCLLGEMRIIMAGAPLPPPPFRAQRLLAALLLYPGVQRRSRLAGLLFPDRPEPESRSRLSDLLYLLRRALPALPLRLSKESVSLPAEARWLDVEAFRQLARQDNPAALFAALDLYPGALLVGYDADWILEERESLHLHYVRLAHQACDCGIRLQQYERVAAIAERLVREEPYDENALRALMRAYQALGRRGGALSAFERFASVVTAELGVEPEAETTALAQSIREAIPGTCRQPARFLPNSSLDEVLHAARTALDRGERATVQAALERLQAQPSAGRALEVSLLEADFALYFEEHERACRVLQACPPDSAPVLARKAELALERHDWAAVCALAGRALLLAHEAGDLTVEARSLTTLALARGERGELSLALRSGEQALSLVRGRRLPAEIARALAILGRLLALRGQSGQAQAHLGEALSLAREHHLPRPQAQALRMVAGNLLHGGRLLDALAVYQEALSIWRDLGIRSREAALLQDIAYIYDHLGRSAESLRVLRQAQALLVQLDDPIRQAINRYNLANTLLYSDERLASEAIAHLRAALDVFAAHGQDGWAASSLSTLGYALWVQGCCDEALATLREAYAALERMEELAVLPEPLAYQGLVLLSLEQPAAALECTRRAVLGLAQGGMDQDLLAEVYYAHAMALAANGQENQAERYLRRAYDKQVELAAQLEDEPARQSFFERDPLTRRMMREVYRRGLAPAPGAGVATLRLSVPGRERPVAIRWTLDAGPSDLALKQSRGAIALRRARLARLMHQARQSGIIPTAAQLADALGVSLRTVRRDLAALK